MKKAFTLAEVLITLGIIGIVSAITLPTLITNYQKKKTVSQLQRAISVLNQAYRQSVDDLGDSIDEAYNMGTKEYINTYWGPYLKINQICEKYSDCGYTNNRPFYKPNGKDKQGSDAFVRNSRIGVKTMDGFTYIFFTSNWTAEGGFSTPTNWVWVDLNGEAKPNIFGKDVFELRRIDDKGIQPLGYGQSETYVNNFCTENNGATCAEKIRRAGWVIDKSYPWK